MTLAIFDLDNTLIAGDSDHLWGEFLCDREVVDSKEFRATNARFYADYQRGELDIAAYAAFALGPLTGRTPRDMAPLLDEFLRTRIEPLMLPAAQALIASHRERGHRPLIITATNEFITRPIADRLGIADLLGCAVELAGGVYTGRATGTLTYREGKVARLKEWLDGKRESLDDAWFYSDSHNDLPLLELVAHPVVVDPDDTLAGHGRDRGWPQLTLRDGAQPRRV